MGISNETRIFSSKIKKVKKETFSNIRHSSFSFLYLNFIFHRKNTVDDQAYPIERSSLIQKLSLQWDLRTGPYRAFFPQEEAERKFCQDILDKAPDDTILFAACQDTRTGEIVASLYLEDAFEMIDNSEKATAFNLQKLGEERLSKMVILSQISFVKGEEKTMISQVLMSHCFIEVLKIGGQGVLLDSDVGHFSIYKRLGMRPIGALYKSSENGHSIPMVFLPDEDYLALINSPVLNLLRGITFSHYKSICQWYYQLVRKNTELQVGSAYYPETTEEYEGHYTITEGLTDKGRASFLKNAMVVKCRQGEVLITENDRGKAFGFIQRGIVKVVIANKTVVLLSEGDIFGEIAFILNSKRSAEVIAISPRTEVVLFSADAINQLENEADKAVIWRNLSRVLAQRVVLTNKMLG